jgi:hypothetical protein
LLYAGTDDSAHDEPDEQPHNEPDGCAHVDSQSWSQHHIDVYEHDFDANNFADHNVGHARRRGMLLAAFQVLG